MLKDFLYLDQDALSRYASQVEDGLRVIRSTTSTSARSAGSGTETDITSDRQGETAAEQVAVSFSDTPEAQFERLISGVAGHEDDFGWVTVESPADELPKLRVGSFISVRGDFYLPTFSKALASSDKIRDLADTMKAMSSFMSAANLAKTELPDPNQVDALVAFADATAGNETVIGEFDNTQWKVFGQIRDRVQRDDFDGDSYIVGKIQSILPNGSWKPLLTMPGMDLLSRSDRREMEKNGPTPDQQENWVKGPALMINVLAIYR